MLSGVCSGVLTEGCSLWWLWLEVACDDVEDVQVELEDGGGWLDELFRPSTMKKRDRSLHE